VINSSPDQSPKDELTTTLSLSALRAVNAKAKKEEILSLLSESEIGILNQLDLNAAMLIVLSGPGKGSRYLLDTSSISIGRDASSSIFLDDVTVSRKHAVITLEVNGGFTVEDQRSLNGTYVNGVSTKNTSLKFGDEIQIGKYRLTFLKSINVKGERE